MKSDFRSLQFNAALVLISNNERKCFKRLFLCLDAYIECFNLRQRQETECLFISKIKSGNDSALTYEYINVSGAKPKLYNLPPSMTKRKENREKPSGDASARLTNKGPAKLVPC